MGQYIPDLTERFPEGYGGIDMTPSYFGEPVDWSRAYKEDYEDNKEKEMNRAIAQLMENGLNLAEAKKTVEELKVEISKATASHKYYDIDNIIKAKGLSPSYYFDIIFA